MLLFKLWIFDFDFSSLVAFLIGIALGCALLAIIYSILVVASLKSKKYIIPTKNVEVTDEEILEIINTAKKQFKDSSLKGANNTIMHCKDICFCLVSDIARKFYPKSKRPFAELSVDEFLELFVYVSKRVNDIIDRPALRLIKKVKLSTILSLGDAKKIIDDSELMKITKKYHIKQIFSKIVGVLNVVNPVYWIRRTVINTSLDFAIKKLCDVVISIVGEESYKIYSKKVFEEPKYIDTNIDEIIQSLDEDLVDVTDEEIESYINSQGIEEKIKERKKRK